MHSAIGRVGFYLFIFSSSSLSSLPRLLVRRSFNEDGSNIDGGGAKVMQFSPPAAVSSQLYQHLDQSISGLLFRKCSRNRYHFDLGCFSVVIFSYTGLKNAYISYD
jgi:hypothetical protein